MRCKILILLATTALAGSPPRTKAAVILGASGNFAVLAGTTVTNTGATIIDGGNVGVSPGTAITGFPPGIVIAPFTTVPGIPPATQAHSDLVTAFNAAAALAPTQILSGVLDGLTLTPGVYSMSAASLSAGAMLKLDDQGNPNAEFVFQAGTTLITGAGASVVTINSGGGTTPGATVFWQVGSSATLGAASAFEGHILAFTSITLTSNSTILDGSALAINGAVTLDTNHIINRVNGAASVPEPSTMILSLVGVALLGLPALGKRWRERRPRD
jgi:Ice-binding-like